MKIGINLLGESGLSGGSGRTARNIILNFQKIDKANEYFVYFHKDYDITVFDQYCENFHFIKVINSSNLIARRLAEQFVLPFYCWKNHVDRILSTNNIGVIPLLNKNIMYILDLAHWKKGSKDTNLTHKLFLNPLQYISAIVSRKIITISEFSKKDIVQTLKIPAEKIAVIYLGIDSQKFTISSKENVQKVMTKFKITGDYIFSYSGILPHKNYLRLCEAFKKSELPVNLVISGKRTSHSEELIAKINELKMQARIQYIEYASDNDLVDLISGSLYYTNVSYFEGAGTTPLEAMLCKKAVLIGDVPSVREYVNNYGYYVDPLSIDSICDGLVDLYNNLDLRDKLQFDGYKWALKFDYKEYCKKLILILCN